MRVVAKPEPADAVQAGQLLRQPPVGEQYHPAGRLTLTLTLIRTLTLTLTLTLTPASALTLTSALTVTLTPTLTQMAGEKVMQQAITCGQPSSSSVVMIGRTFLPRS